MSSTCFVCLHAACDSWQPRLWSSATLSFGPLTSSQADLVRYLEASKKMSHCVCQQDAQGWAKRWVIFDGYFLCSTVMANFCLGAAACLESSGVLYMSPGSSTGMYHASLNLLRPSFTQFPYQGCHKSDNSQAAHNNHVLRLHCNVDIQGTHL